MFSVTAEVYCGSVCGKDHVHLAQLPPQLVWKGEKQEWELQMSPYIGVTSCLERWGAEPGCGHSYLGKEPFEILSPGPEVWGEGNQITSVSTRGRKDSSFFLTFCLDPFVNETNDCNSDGVPVLPPRPHAVLSVFLFFWWSVPVCLPLRVPVSPGPGPLASAISTTMTESSFSCGLSSEMSECNVSVRYECTSRLTLGMPITTDTAGARRGDTGQGSGDSLSARLSPLPGHAHTSGATLAHPHCGLQTALLGQQVRQMVEDGGQMKHVPVRDVPRLQSRILWVGGKGAGQILLGLKTARLLQNPPPHPPDPAGAHPLGGPKCDCPLRPAAPASRTLPS